MTSNSKWLNGPRSKGEEVFEWMHIQLQDCARSSDLWSQTSEPIDLSNSACALMSWFRPSDRWNARSIPLVRSSWRQSFVRVDNNKEKPESGSFARVFSHKTLTDRNLVPRSSLKLKLHSYIYLFFTAIRPHVTLINIKYTRVGI